MSIKYLYECDWCGANIDGVYSIRGTVYPRSAATSVSHTAPRDFCSAVCLGEWAKRCEEHGWALHVLAERRAESPSTASVTHGVESEENPA